MPTGPAIVVEPPLRSSWPQGLVNYARATGRLFEHEDDRMVNGISFSPNTCAEPEAYGACSATVEVQTVVLTGAPTGGTFTLTYSPTGQPAQTTAPIAFNATAAAVAAALNLLPGIAGGVTATGGPLPGTLVTITFSGANVAGDQPQLTGSGTGLTPSGGVTTATTANGTGGATKASTATRGARRNFFPVVIIGRDQCQAGNPQSVYEARAAEHLEVHWSTTLERQLWTGTIEPTSPFFANGTATTVGAANTTLSLGLAELVQALASGGVAGGGVIHARPKIVELWQAGGHLHYDGDCVLRTPTGIAVVAGDGYPGTGPAGQAVTATSEWAFATGAMDVHASPIFLNPATLAGAVNRSTNQVDYRAERSAVAIWGGCVTAAVSINPTTP